MKHAPFPPVPGNAKKLDVGPFCEYWNALPVIQHTNAVLYAQRLIPIMKGVVTVDNYGKRHVTHPSCLKLYREHGPITEQLLINKLGYGKYSFRLNDSRISIKTNPDAATIVYGDLDTPTIWGDCPPNLDYKQLDMADDRNGQFLIWAKSRGLIPNESTQESEDMQNVQAGVADRLTSTVERLTDKVIAQAESKEKQQPAPAAVAPAPAANSGDGGAIKAVADLAIAVLNRPQPATADPLVMLQGMATVVSSLVPKPDNSSADLAKEVVKESAAANERVFKMQEQAIDQMRKEIAEARAPAVTAQPVTPPTRRQLLEDAVEEQKLLKTLGRGGSAAEEESSKPSSIDKWAEVLPHAAPVIGQFIQGIFQFGLAVVQGWQVTSYNNALARNGGTPLPPTTMTHPDNKQPAPEPGKPIPPQAPAPTPEQQQAQQQWDTIMQGMLKIAPYLIDSLDGGETGAEFAEFIIKRAPEKRTSYERIRHTADTLALIGVQIPGTSELEKFCNACQFVFQKIPTLWAKVGTLTTMPQFLADFFNYDEILKQAQGGEE